MTDDNSRTTAQHAAASGVMWIQLFKAAGWLAVGVGCLPLLLGLWNIVAIAAFNATSLGAEATVISVPSGYGGLRLYYPCRYDREQESIAIEHYKQQRGSYISVGQKVRIRYQPSDPRRARLDIPRPYFWPVLFVVLGLLFAGFGVCFSRFPTLFMPSHRPKRG